MKENMRLLRSVMLLSLLLSVSASLLAVSRGSFEQVELQPLAAQVKRVVEALDYLGAPLNADAKMKLERTLDGTDAAAARASIQQILDPLCLLEIHINPESRVRVTQGQARAELVEAGWRPFLIKVRNEGGATAELKAESLNALPVHSRSRGEPRPPHTIEPRDLRDRWLVVDQFTQQPLKRELSGLGLEYRIIQLYSRDAGKREARIGFNVGQGTQDIGFRNDVAILFTCHPSSDITLRVLDADGQPTTASFLIRDAQGHVYPAQIKRLAPDFAFHPQIYRANGEKVRLPAGNYQIEYTRGPEYLVKKQTINVTAGKAQSFNFQLERWVDPARKGWYSGDHHIHAAGCMHYDNPTQGVLPEDMIRHILGEALNVGTVLTWGPCYYHQKQFFEGKEHQLSTPSNLMRYDVEISGFPSSHNGHLVLMRLKDQDYPGTKELEDWPTWNLPILKWAKSQGAVTGYAHSAFGLEVPTNQLPNYEMPKFDGIGANEYIVDVTHDAIDFISTVDTPAVRELNIWYHTLNCGFRTRISGETDFPCIYGERVGMGRSYVQLDSKLKYDDWVEGVRLGRSYVSEGRTHLLDFRVNDQLVGRSGSEISLATTSTVRVTTQVAARLDEQPKGRARASWDLERARIGVTREVPVDVIVNGEPVARKNVIADGTLHNLTFDIAIESSSWIAVRVLHAAHSNPVFVTVKGQPIRASRRSAEWCLRAVDQCWSSKAPRISTRERPEAALAYEHAREVYRRILAETTAR